MSASATVSSLVKAVRRWLSVVENWLRWKERWQERPSISCLIRHSIPSRKVINGHSKTKNLAMFHHGSSVAAVLGNCSWNFSSTHPCHEEIKTNGNIRAITNLLFGFMMIDKTLRNQAVNSQLGRPPKCRLEWGHDTPFHFECYVTDCSVTYSLFSEDGMPIRATAQITLKEVKDPDNLAMQNPTSGGDPGRRIHVVREGDRIDLIAYRQYGDASAWRLIADAN